MSLLVERASTLMSVQDLGRAGFARFGLPESGPMDWWAQRAANRLVGNPADAACLEVGFTDAVVRVDEDALLSVCGAGYQEWVNQRQIPLWVAFLAQRGVTGCGWRRLLVETGCICPQPAAWIRRFGWARTASTPGQVWAIIWVKVT